VPPFPALATPARELRIVTLGCLLYVGGQSLFFLMPAFLALLGNRLALDTAQLGTLAGAESLAFALTSLAAPLWIHRVDLRRAIVAGVIVFTVGSIATAFCPTFATLLALRIVVGLLGEGVLGTISFRFLGSARDVDRAFAIALTGAVVFGAAVMAGAAALAHVAPRFGLLLAMIAMALAIVPFVGWTSALAGAAGTEAERSRGGGIGPSALIALAAQALWFGAPGAFWTFAEQVATDKGMTNHAAEVILSIGELVALVGCTAAAALGDRLGRIVPITCASAGLAISAIVFAGSAGTIVMAVCLAVFYTFWNYGVVYQMSFVTQLDTSGNAAVVMPAVQVIGLSVGPFVAGWLITAHGDGAVTASTLSFIAAGLALYVVALVRFRRPAPVRA
jgi:predicted MFS family arabinose efflux permease